MKKNILFIGIDLQNDFMDIPGATLGVPGGVADTERVCALIEKVNPTTIFSSLDSHFSLDIAHIAWFAHADGTMFGPKDYYSNITSNDLKNGKVTARISPGLTLKYLEDLEANGEFPHTIWPDHCLMGTPGQALLPIYFETLKNWQNKNRKWVNFIRKGENPYTEHFGIFRANVPVPEDSSTQVNQGAFKAMNDADEIYLYGQARTHCVINSLKQMLEIAPQLASKIKVIGDCTSNVANLPADFYNYVDSLYANAISKGVEIVKSTDF